MSWQRRIPSFVGTHKVRASDSVLAVDPQRRPDPGTRSFVPALSAVPALSRPTLSLVGLPFQAAPLSAHRHPSSVTRRQVQTHAALARSQQKRFGLAIAITAFLDTREAPQWPIRTGGPGGPSRTDNKGARTRFARSTAQLLFAAAAVWLGNRRESCVQQRPAAPRPCPGHGPANHGSFRTALCS